MNNFEYGDKVDVKFDNIEFYGKVVGVADTGNPVIGKKYMVMDESGQFPNETYPYECVGVFECFMKQRN